MGVEKAAFFLKGMFLPKRLVTPWRRENWRGLCQQLIPPGCWQGRVVGGLPAVHGLAPARSWSAAPLSSCEAAVEAKCGRGGWHARQDMGASWPPWRLLQAEGGDVYCLYLGDGLGCGLEAHGAEVLVRGGDRFHAPRAGTDLLLRLLTAVRADPAPLSSGIPAPPGPLLWGIAPRAVVTWGCRLACISRRAWMPMWPSAALQRGRCHQPHS